MEKMITCINCPVGCRMSVSLSGSGEFLSVSGNTCPRGAEYARQECILPQRTVTAVIPVRGNSEPLSVKTSKPVPKSLISQIMRELSSVHVKPPFTIGDVIISNVLDTGADIVATRNME